jgi:bifunctional DNA-binding transcriptional regulator/antitoxin component of YhaV-PrlF toxin-antitoxin module
VIVPAAKVGSQPRFCARVKLRPKAQLTLPEEIRRVLHSSEGGEVEFSVHDDGTITVRGYVSIPTDQAWFFALEWLAGEREADQEIAAGRGHVRPLGRARRFGCLIPTFETLPAPDRPFRPDPRVKGGPTLVCSR